MKTNLSKEEVRTAEEIMPIKLASQNWKDERYDEMLFSDKRSAFITGFVNGYSASQFKSQSEAVGEQKEALEEMFNRWIDDDGNPPDIDKVVKTLRPDLKMELKALEGEEIFTRQDVKNLMEIARAPLVKNLDYCHKRMAEAYTEIERLKSKVSVGEEKKD